MKIAFVGMMTLLDRYSGAALSVRAFLEQLAAAGHECASFTATSFDRRSEIPLESVLGEGVTAASHRGSVVLHRANGVSHHVFVTSSTHRSGVERDEWIRMAETGIQWIRDSGADLFITFGTNPITAILQREARATGARLVFYLGNAELKDRDRIHDTDTVVCPSEFLASHYRRTLGLQPDVVRTIIPADRFLQPEAQLYRLHPGWRRHGLVTFINPQPIKGVGVVARLIESMPVHAPDMTFLVVSGRLDARELAFFGRPLRERQNVWCIDSREDVRSIYRRTSILLLPSVWLEGASRTIAEAQLSGIPVLASDRGGNRERLNGGGYCLPLPDRLLADRQVIPTQAELDTWLETLLLLWNDEAAYADAADRALSSAAPFHPAAVAGEAIAYFEQLA